MMENKRNDTLYMDLYELTMANGYFLSGHGKDEAVFDVFYRKNPDNGGFAIFAGLEQVLEYIENLHFSADDLAYLKSLHMFDDGFLDYLKSYRFKGSLDAVAEGTIVYPNEPLLTVKAPLLDAQLLETAILAQINHQSLIATKTRRIVTAANGRSVVDFGARRAHNFDAGVYGARAAYIGGAMGTATVQAGKMFDIPVSGTMAHSFVMYYENEYDAFRAFAEYYPDNTVILVDTYDILHSGVPNAIRLAKEVLEVRGQRLKGVRLDSGDLAYLSRRVREMLDEAGLQDAKIFVSNSLDEYTIRSLLRQGAKIDAFGVGERLITAKSDPVFGSVYKISEVIKNGKKIPKIKISDSVEKITNPSQKELYRIYDKEGYAIADLLTLKGEKVDLRKPYPYIYPIKPWKKLCFENCTKRKLQEEVLRNGKRVKKLPTLQQIRDFVKKQLQDEIWQEEQRFENPHVHYLDMSPAYYDLKIKLLHKFDKN